MFYQEHNSYPTLVNDDINDNLMNIKMNLSESGWIDDEMKDKKIVLKTNLVSYLDNMQTQNLQINYMYYYFEIEPVRAQGDMHSEYWVMPLKLMFYLLFYALLSVFYCPEHVIALSFCSISCSYS